MNLENVMLSEINQIQGDKYSGGSTLTEPFGKNKVSKIVGARC